MLFPLLFSFLLGVGAPTVTSAVPLESSPTTISATTVPVAAPRASATTTSAVPAATTIASTTTTTAPPPVEGPAPLRSIVFPVMGPVIYSDSFGDCRDNCTRLHQGIDLIGVQLQPLVSTVNGTVTKIVYEGRLSGNGVVITDDEGWTYVYYHLNDEPPGFKPLSSPEATADAIARWHLPPTVAVGQRVTMGQVIGWMGNSGNAKQSVTHLHFEIHDPAGVPVNPYTTLRAAEFIDRCLPPFQRPTPITSPPQVVASTTFVFPTSTGLGQFTVSTSGGVLADGDGNSIGNPNFAKQSCADPIPLMTARRLPETPLPPADAEPTTTTTTTTTVPTTVPTTTVPTTSVPTTTAGPTTTAASRITSSPANGGGTTAPQNATTTAR
ncbi:MAG: putative metalloendopeptidase [Acidimicrobiia bacterium]|nr:putative metalloendopeptidase [Acidimicrobiia bacterium]